MTHPSAVMAARSQREADPQETEALATHLPFTMLGQMKCSDSWTFRHAPVPTKLAHFALVADTGCPNLRVQVNLTGERGWRFGRGCLYIHCVHLLTQPRLYVRRSH
ncbi:hypothetical protein CGRA01v4_02263 [Colletotrichum graminicola]|nr:hypothetical protein CGRA01v4_02263 [Colletotrichum graminicola]